MASSGLNKPRPCTWHSATALSPSSWAKRTSETNASDSNCLFSPREGQICRMLAWDLEAGSPWPSPANDKEKEPKCLQTLKSKKVSMMASRRRRRSTHAANALLVHDREKLQRLCAVSVSSSIGRGASASGSGSGLAHLLDDLDTLEKLVKDTLGTIERVCPSAR